MMNRVVVAFVLGVSSVSGQFESDLGYQEIGRAGRNVRCLVATPKGSVHSSPHPVLLVLKEKSQPTEASMSAFRSRWHDLVARKGWIVVQPMSGNVSLPSPGDLHALLEGLRIRHRVEGEQFHLLSEGKATGAALELVVDRPYEFASITVVGGVSPSQRVVRRSSSFASISTRIYVHVNDKGADLLSASIREAGGAVMRVSTGLPGTLSVWEDLRRGRWGSSQEEKGVHVLLDDLHDAATKADEVRYFGHFSPEGVFLGTDATERWSVEEFKSYALPYFQGESAWLYVPVSRNVQLAPGGEIAWFDEILHNAKYGECRGTGVVRRIGGSWKVAQYNLTVPVPNDLLARVAAEIARYRDGLPIDEVTVFLVRHAEKDISDLTGDPDLTPAGRQRSRALAEMLRSARVDAVYATEFQRTRKTAKPTADAAGIPVAVITAGDMAGLSSRLLRHHAGGVVLVSGHSNTLPRILKHLGVNGDIAIQDGEYDNLFVVRISASEGTRLTRVRFPALVGPEGK